MQEIAAALDESTYTGDTAQTFDSPYEHLKHLKQASWADNNNNNNNNNNSNSNTATPAGAEADPEDTVYLVFDRMSKAAAGDPSIQRGARPVLAQY